MNPEALQIGNKGDKKGYDVDRASCTWKPSRLAKPTALSTMLLRSMAFLPRLTAEAARTTLALQSRIRTAMDSGEKPAKMTEWTAPILAHASCSKPHDARETVS